MATLPISAVTRVIWRGHQQTRSRGWSTWSWGVIASFLLLLVVGFALRWAFLFAIPAQTDETDDIIYSLPVLLGQPVPATNFDTFNGGLYTGLIAAVLRLTGLDPAAPRVVSWIGGGLTVGATYVLGRAVGGHGVGLVAGALLAVIPAHILINSHVAWSNSLTPLFTTGALSLLVLGIRTGRAALLPIAGLLGGLALQSHASTVALVPGVLVALCVDRRHRRALTFGLILAAIAVVLVELPVLRYNLTNGFESIQYAFGHRPADDQETEMTVIRYTENFLGLIGAVARTLAGRVADRYQTSVTAPFDDWPVIAAGSLGLLGLAALAIRSQWLLVLPTVSFAVILPLLNGKYEPTMMNARYIMPLVPLVCAGVGIIAQWAWARWPGRLEHGGLVLLAVIVAGWQIGNLSEFYSQAMSQRLTSASVASAADYLAKQTRGPVLLDETLFQRYTYAGGRALKTLIVSASLRGTPFRVVPQDDALAYVPPKEPRLAVLTDSTLERLVPRAAALGMQIRTVIEAPEQGRLYDSFGVYSLEPIAASGTEVRAPTPCFLGTVTSWQVGDAQSPTVVQLAPARTLIIPAIARSKSVMLQELDRVHRPVGRGLVVCTSPRDASESSTITIRGPQQLTFLPLSPS